MDPVVFPGRQDQVAGAQELRQGPDCQTGDHLQPIGAGVQQALTGLEVKQDAGALPDQVTKPAMGGGSGGRKGQPNFASGGGKRRKITGNN